ncbi:MAG: hypothetical protein ACQSGP_10855 [Frankia sp.]
MKAVDDARKSYASTPGKWGIPAGWGTATSHHKISKEHFELLGKAVQLCLDMRSLGRRDKNRDEEQIAAVEPLWDLIATCAGPEVAKQAGGKSGSPVKMLWNLPVNLEVGPDMVEENPGVSFDPNTEPGVGVNRRLTAESAALRDLERVFLPAVRRGPTYLPTPDEWARIGVLLQTAQDAFEKDLQTRLGGGLLARPRAEQWIPSEKDVKGVKVPAFQRKRLRRFPGLATGLATFNANRANDVLATTVNALPGGWPRISVQHGTDSDNNQHALTINWTAAQMMHMCQRHTYRYFPRTPDFVKLVNNFWPVAQVNTAAQFHAKVAAALPNIAQAMIECMESDEVLDTYEGTIVAVNVPSGGDQLFFIAKFETDDPGSLAWNVDLETVAPDGESAECFPRDELNQVH